jgi:hypothetical protein
MKKIYALIVVVMCFYATGISQVTYTWNGSANTTWENNANWTRTGGGVGYPVSGDNAIFNTNATVVFNGNVTLNSLSVSGSGTDVTIDGSAALRQMTVSNTTSALSIASGTVLRLTSMDFVIANNAKGTVAGVLSLEGTVSDYAMLRILSPTGMTTKLTVTGSLISNVHGGSIDVTNDSYLVFGSGSKLEIKGSEFPSIPKADYNPASEIIISGAQSHSVSCNEVVSVGKITYNCPAQATSLFLNLYNGLTVAGDLDVQNTNGKTLILMSNFLPPSKTSYSLTVTGDLNISGNSKVTVSEQLISGSNPYQFTINGNLVAGGQSFSLQDGNAAGIDPTTLFIKGDIQHTAGSFVVGSGQTSQSQHLFIIEMSGNGTQTISSYNGLFDDGFGQLTLRINNSTGVSLLSNLEVGRVSFNSAEKGIINTNSNSLTLTNTSNNSLVMESPDVSGYINGNVRRTVVGTDELFFATGTGAEFRPVSIFPQINTTSVYEVGIVNEAYSDLSTQAPINGIAPYYWNINKISGADAKIRLTLSGAVPGAGAEDGLVALKYDGNDWISVRATGSVLNGTATSGTLETIVLSTFSPFSIGYALNAALPINLLSFTAKKRNSSAQINWKITDNSTPEAFEVMKSSDGVHFSVIGKLSGFSGKLNYDYTDNSLISGNNYYRLRMTDKDGSVSYSTIVVVMNGTKGVMISSMIPTMVVDRARLNISSSEKGNLQLVVTDISGRVVHTQNATINAGKQEIWLNAMRLSPGIFQITGYINGEKTATVRFFKR